MQCIVIVIESTIKLDVYLPYMYEIKLLYKLFYVIWLGLFYYLLIPWSNLYGNQSSRFILCFFSKIYNLFITLNVEFGRPCKMGAYLGSARVDF